MDEKILNDFNLSLSNDAVFKHYYSVASNLSVLVSLILGEEVLPEDITYLSNEVIITPKVKKPRFDLRILIQNRPKLQSAKAQLRLLRFTLRASSPHTA